MTETSLSEALWTKTIVPWGVECESCGLVVYGEWIDSPCVACKSIELTPLFAGRPKDVLAAQ